MFHFSNLEETGEVQTYNLALNRSSRDTFLYPHLPITSSGQLGLSEYLKNQLTLEGNNTHTQNRWEGLILCRYLNVNTFLA